MTADELLAVIRQVLRQRFAILAHELTPAMIAAFRARGLDIVERLKLTTDLRGMVDKRAAAVAAGLEEKRCIDRIPVLIEQRAHRGHSHNPSAPLTGSQTASGLIFRSTNAYRRFE